jgi:hypothetical protein
MHAMSVCKIFLQEFVSTPSISQKQMLAYLIKPVLICTIKTRQFGFEMQNVAERS